MKYKEEDAPVVEHSPIGGVEPLLGDGHLGIGVLDLRNFESCNLGACLTEGETLWNEVLRLGSIDLFHHGGRLVGLQHLGWASLRREVLRLQWQCDEHRQQHP